MLVKTAPAPAVYVPLAARTWPWVSFAVRLRDARAVLTAALRRAVLDVEPSMMPVGPGPAVTFTSVERSLSASLAPRRYVLGLIGAFSLCALVPGGGGTLWHRPATR